MMNTFTYLKLKIRLKKITEDENHPAVGKMASGGERQTKPVCSGIDSGGP